MTLSTYARRSHCHNGLNGCPKSFVFSAMPGLIFPYEHVHKILKEKISENKQKGVSNIQFYAKEFK